VSFWNVVTERQGHGVDIAKEIDIEAFDSIVTVSGDGVIHEVINGFLQRPDAREAIRKLPLGVIPGGTGNALSVSLLGEKAGFDPQYTALQVIKGMSHRVKLWETSQIWLNIKLTFRKTYGL
jgi:sphingosine kinase